MSARVARRVGVLAAVSGLVVSGCSVGQDAVGLELGGYGLCGQEYARSVCAYGVNNVQTFTGPGQLGVGGFDVTAWDIVNGHDPGETARTKYLGQYWKTPWVQDTSWLGMAWGHSGGPEGTVYYGGPAALKSEGAALYYKDPMADAANQVACSGVQEYVGCQAVKYDQTDQDNWNAEYTISNSPVTVAIVNGLPNTDGSDTVYASAAPGWSGFLADPTGSSMNTTGDYRVEAGSTRYFGMYRWVNNSSSQTSVFSITYKATDKGSSVPGGVFTLNLALDNSTGALATGGGCTFQGAGATIAYCVVNVAGGATGPQTVTVTLSENS